jgi:hypothetical protein
MSFLPSVVRAEYRNKFRIQLTFNDGTIETVDFSQWLEGPVFEPLHDAQFFRRFFIEAGTVCWPNGADIAPETLYEAATREKRSNTTPKPTSGASSSKSKRSRNTRRSRLSV